MAVEYSTMEQKLKQLQEDYQRLENERNEMEADFLQQASTDSASEVSSNTSTGRVQANLNPPPAH